MPQGYPPPFQHLSIFPLSNFSNSYRDNIHSNAIRKNPSINLYNNLPNNNPPTFVHNEHNASNHRFPHINHSMTDTHYQGISTENKRQHHRNHQRKFDNNKQI